MLTYYIIDTETTGLKAGYHDLVEISAIRYDNKLQFTKIIKALHPENASIDALRITNKTPDDLLKGDDLEYSIRSFDRYIKSDGLEPKHRVAVGHNVAFDIRFLHAAFAKFDLPFPMDMSYDTMAYMRKHLKKNGIPRKGTSLKLGDSIKLLNIKKLGTEESDHTAKMDTRNTYWLFDHILTKECDPIVVDIKKHPHVIGAKEEETQDNLMDD